MRKFGLSFLSGTLLSFVHSLSSATVFSLVAVGPLAWSLKSSSLKERLLLTCCTGFLFQGWVHRWAIPYSPEGWLVLTLLKLLPMLLLALYPIRNSFGFAALWVVIEWLNSIGPLGHTGGSLSLAWAEYPLAIQSAAFAGPWLLSFTLALLGAALAYRERRGFLVAGGLLVTLTAIGLYNLAGERKPNADFRIGVVQSCLERHLKFLDPVPPEPLQQLKQLTHQAAEAADLIVWPETAFPGVGLRWDANWATHYGRLARDTKTSLLLASLEPEGNGFLNSLHVVEQDGRFQSRYSKQRRVPFVEHLPWESLRSCQLFGRVNRILEGQEAGVVEVQGRSLGMMICWESMSPMVARARTKHGAELLIVSTNDEWFEPGDDVAEAHFRMAVFRAVENNRPLAQAANTGISALVDSRGRIVARSRQGQRTYLVGELDPQQGLTLYTRWGDWFLVLLGLLWLILARRKGS